MAANLYPLLYKPGIQRDGTNFQPEYCTAGQWVRFQRGKVKKIGGMQGISLRHSDDSVPRNVSNITTVETNIILASHSTGITKVQLANNTPYPPFTTAARATKLFEMPNDPNVLWNVLKIVSEADRQPYLIFMPTANARIIDINYPMQAANFKIKLTTTLNDNIFSSTVLTGVNPLCNGGMCFIYPYLFLYGSNGLVQYSRAATPFEFEGAGSGSITMPSGDKVIYGTSIRGGSGSPSLLFWTLSSVVWVTNVGSSAVLFKSDMISRSSSILSSRSVIEYDGIFFWVGTDKFFVWNGLVRTMKNKMNLNYFFDNIDMDRRQEVFGFKHHTRFGEIGWAYPVRGVAGVSRAVIYNVEEDFWYDMALPRTAAVFSDNGYLITSGSPVTALAGDTGNYLWKHEVGTQQSWTPDSTNAERNDPIESYITTPTISLAAFPPGMREETQGGKLIDRWIELKRIEPDFIGATGGVTTFTVNVNTREYAQSPIVVGGGITFNTATEKIDIHAQGRNISLTFTSSGTFEMGNILLSLGIGDSR